MVLPDWIGYNSGSIREVAHEPAFTVNHGHLRVGMAPDYL